MCFGGTNTSRAGFRHAIAVRSMAAGFNVLKLRQIYVRARVLVLPWSSLGSAQIRWSHSASKISASSTTSHSAANPHCSQEVDTQLSSGVLSGGPFLRRDAATNPNPARKTRHTLTPSTSMLSRTHLGPTESVRRVHTTRPA